MFQRTQFITVCVNRDIVFGDQDRKLHDAERERASSEYTCKVDDPATNWWA